MLSCNLTCNRNSEKSYLFVARAHPFSTQLTSARVRVLEASSTHSCIPCRDTVPPLSPPNVVGAAHFSIRKKWLPICGGLRKYGNIFIVRISLLISSASSLRIFAGPACGTWKRSALTKRWRIYERSLKVLERYLTPRSTG